MLDFANPSYLKLRNISVDTVSKEIEPLLISGEQLLMAAKGARDFIVFTNKRLICVNVQGITGKKKDYSSLPYSRIQAFSVETAGTLDLDTELELWFSGLGKVKLEFNDRMDMRGIAKLIGNHMLA